VPAVFCLPIDFASQVVLTASFVLSLLPSCLPKVHAALAAAGLHSWRLACAHAALLSALGRFGALGATALYHGTWAAPRVGGGAAAGKCPVGGDGGGGGTCDAGVPGGGVDALAAVAACWWVLFVCGALPVWVAFHVERVHKHRWLALNAGARWTNAPRDGTAGAWPAPRAAARQLGALLLATAAAAEVVVAVLRWLGVPY
jgi:hypothetical protein